MYPLLSQSGRATDECCGEGANIFSFSVAMIKQFSSSTANLERFVCARGDARAAEEALLEGC